MTQKHTMPPLISLRAFAAFSRHGLVRDAADELGVSHTVVSRHIQNLEYFLKIKLVQKSGRNLVLTDAGTLFAEQINQAFGIISSASTNLRRGKNSTLHLSCMAGLASRRILGVLQEIEQAIGVGSITLQPQLLGPDLVHGGADVELTYSETVPATPGLKAEVFATPRILPVASPGFMRQHGPVESVADLARLPLIFERSPGQWQHWLAKAGLTDIPDLHGIKLWHGHLTLEGARLGQGVALVSSLIAMPSFENGELVKVTDSLVYLGDYYMVASTQAWRRPEVRKLRDWLVLAFSQDC